MTPAAFQRLPPEHGTKLEELSVAVAMRNLIAHEYFAVDTRTLVQTAQDDVPALKTKLDRLLDNPS